MLKAFIFVFVLYSVSALLDCDYDGTVHQSGDHFPASDGCNKCFCSNGAVACTLKFCLPKVTCTYGNATHHEGESFKAMDGCNSCSCHKGAVSCTEMFCHPATELPPV